MKATKKKPNHALFWTLLKRVPGYNEAYKEVIKEGIVSEASGGRTQSLSELYEKYPKEYSLMIEKLKGDSDQKQMRYDAEQEKARRRVIAVICAGLDKRGYKFGSAERKVEYAKRVACNASNCGRFNAIPLSRLQAIYNDWLKKNEVNVNCNPALDIPVNKN